MNRTRSSVKVTTTGQIARLPSALPQLKPGFFDNATQHVQIFRAVTRDDLENPKLPVLMPR